MLFPYPALLPVFIVSLGVVDCPFEALLEPFVCVTALAVVEGNASGMVADGCRSSRVLEAELGRLRTVTGGN